MTRALAALAAHDLHRLLREAPQRLLHAAAGQPAGLLLRRDGTAVLLLPAALAIARATWPAHYPEPCAVPVELLAQGLRDRLRLQGGVRDAPGGGGPCLLLAESPLPLTAAAELPGWAEPEGTCIAVPAPPDCDALPWPELPRPGRRFASLAELAQAAGEPAECALLPDAAAAQVRRTHVLRLASAERARLQWLGEPLPAWLAGDLAEIPAGDPGGAAAAWGGSGPWP